MELKIGLNNMQSKTSDTHANCACRCVDVGCPIDAQEMGDYCANQIAFARLANSFNFIFYPKLVGDEWHKLDCSMGDCSSCGINTLKVYPTKELLCVSRMVQ